MNPTEQTERFCSVLFADPGGLLDGHHATVWSAHSKVTRWPPASDLAAIAKAIRDADSPVGALATYVGMALARNAGPLDRRARNDQVGAMVALWLDVDYAGPAHEKKNLPPTELDARRVIDSVGLPPTLVWNSGHGLQAAWRLAEPWVFEPGSAEADEAAAAARDWNLTFAVQGHRMGRWAVDRVHDLSRLLRAPGTINRKIKDDHRLVVLREVNETAQYSVDDLLERVVDREHLAQFAGVGTAPVIGGGAASVDLDAVWRLVTSRAYRERSHEPEWISGLVQAKVFSDDDTLIKVFRKGHSSGDPSSRDASLVRCLANIRENDGTHIYDQRDAVELIMCARLRDGVKTEKVDPSRRRDYVVRTVDRIFASADAADRERIERQVVLGAAASAAIEAQDRGAQRAPAPPPVLPPEPATPATEPARIPRDMGAAMLHGLAAVTTAVVSDPLDSSSDSSVESTLESEPEPTVPMHTATHNPAQPQVEALPPTVHTTVTEPDPYAGLEQMVIGPAPSPWGTRTESQHEELSALSATLFGKRAAYIQIWRLIYRGRGAKQERRALVRVSDGYRWPGVPPEGYQPGGLLPTGWYPAGVFNAVSGWIRALRQDCLLITERVSAEEFADRFGDSLVRLWEPDTSGGSLANVTREALTSYLLDYAPTPEWVEATAQGVPFIVQAAPRWSTDSRFTVLVRWSALARHARTHFAINVTPAIAAEMAELAGARATTTVTQDGQWRAVRRDYLGDAVWAAVLHGGQVAEIRREDRHGLHVVGADHDLDGIGGVPRAAPGAGQ